MITIDVKWYSEHDEETGKRFIKDVMKYLPEYFDDTCNEIGMVQIATSDEIERSRGWTR